MCSHLPIVLNERLFKTLLNNLLKNQNNHLKIEAKIQNILKIWEH